MKQIYVSLIVIVAILLVVFPTPHPYLKEDLVKTVDCSTTLQDGWSISDGWVDMQDLTKIIVDIHSSESVNVVIQSGSTYIYSQSGNTHAYTDTRSENAYVVSVTNPTLLGMGPSADVTGDIRAYHIYNETQLLPWWMP